jgi:hypothetical protein
MFTKKPDPGESATKMGESGESKSPFTERPGDLCRQVPEPGG